MSADGGGVSQASAALAFWRKIEIETNKIPVYQYLKSYFKC
jgi:hypothetical protein